MRDFDQRPMIGAEVANMYRDHATDMRTIGCAMVAPHVAEEIAHDVFVIQWTRDGWDPSLDFRRVYLHGIPRYKAIEWNRSFGVAATRQAILLAYFGGLSYRKVAVALAVPEGTVETRIRAGLAQLGAELGPLLAFE